MEDLDPEKARAIVDPALALMMDAVHRYDGYVVQSTGDGIFALFGAPVAHEDHPQRALYAALRMQQDLRRYSTKVVADGGTPIQCRIGINTGEVVVRSIHTGAGHVEYTPIGHTTNLASRMQTAAPVGSIAVAEATRNLCEGYFTLAPQAEQCFRIAIDIARSQKARFWELRSTISLARLLRKQGNRDDAREMLAEIYGWFTEGFDTADLKDAKALLEQLVI